MSKFLKVPYGDYKVQVQNGGNIVLDTGDEVGQVLITGNLTVLGNQTAIESEDMHVRDNIIVVNFGETGNGVSLNGSTAGLKVERGALPDTFFVFDENVSNVIPGGTDGLFRLYIDTGGSGELKGLQTNHINTGGEDLYLINNGTGVITVEGTTFYQDNIFTYTDIPSGAIDLTGGPAGNGVVSPDTIPNTQSIVDYVDSYFAGVFQDRIEEGSITKTFVETLDREVTSNPSLVQIGVDNEVTAEFYNDRVEINDIRISDTKIETLSTNQDLILSAPGSGAVRIQDVMQLNANPAYEDDVLNLPTAPDDSSAGLKIYANVPGYGDTGLFFVNSFATRDEIISNNKSLVYSMIF